jgi:hypothetical protein
MIGTQKDKEQIWKNDEFLGKEKTPRYSAGQPSIIEFKSANHQTLQQKGDPYGITSRE